MIREDFDKLYNRVIESCKGNLSPEQYKEMITLEYVLTQCYCEKNEYDLLINRYKSLSKIK